jgi:hypothetical protein
MAGQDRSKGTYAAILLPYRLDSANLISPSSYTQDDPMPGSLVTSTTPIPKLQVNAYGDQDSTAYNVQILQGGNVKPDGAAFVWKTSTDGATDYRGWDAPNSIASHSYVERGSAGITVHTPDAAALPSGGVVVVGTYETASNAQVRAYILNPDGTITENNVTGSITKPTSRLSDSFHPTVSIMDDGAIVIVCLVEDTDTETAQVNVYRSTDTGLTFSLVSQYALPEAINVDNDTAGDGYTLRRMRFRHEGGRSLLLIWAQVNNNSANTYPDGYFQFGSDSEGLSWDLVEFALENGVSHTYNGESQVDLSAPFGYPDITNTNGRFYLAYIDQLEGSKLRILSNPYDTISSQSGSNIVIGYSPDIAVITSGHFTDGETAIAADTDGSIYVTHRGMQDMNMILTRTINEGTSWILLGQGISSAPTSLANSWRAGSNLYPVSVNMVAAGGRLYCYGNHEAPTTTTLEGSLSEWALGGWSSVNMAGNTIFGRTTGRAMFAMSYFAGELPGNLSEFTKTSSGTHTESLNTEGLYNTASGSATLFYTHTHSSTPSEGLLVEWVQQQAAGGATTSFLSGVSGMVEDGSAGYEWQVRVSTTSAVLYDNTAGATVSGFAALSLSTDDVIEYRIEMRGSAVQGWYRTHSVFDDRLWTSWGSGTLTSTGGSGTPTNRVTFGGKHSTIAPLTDPEVYFSQIRATYEEYNGSRTLPISNPADLFARDFSGVGQTTTLDANYRINATGGPGRRGDEYTGNPRYGYPIDLLHWPESLSPREAWRSVAGTSQSVRQVLRYQISTLNESTRMPAAIGVYLGGVKGWKDFDLKLYPYGGLPTTHTIQMKHGPAFAFTRYGDTVIPTSVATEGEFLHRNETIGWWLYLDDGAGNTEWVELARNTEGVLGGAAGIPARLTLKNTQTGTPTSGTATIVPANCVVIVHLQNEDLHAVELDIPAQDAYGNRIQIGSLWVGEVYAFPNGPELGTRYTTTSSTRVSETDARITTTQAVGPTRREISLAWTALDFTGEGEGQQSDPNFTYATAAAGAVPMAAPDVLPYTVEGLYRLCNGPEIPVVYLRQMEKQGAGSQVRLLTCRTDVIPAIMTGQTTIRDTAGVPGNIDAKTRGEALTITEIV